MSINLYKDLPAGEKVPDQINVVVDIPSGSSNKYEYNQDKGYFILDRIIHSPMFYPFEYGFIPQTKSEDGDSLDVVLLTTYATFPGCVISARPIGVLYMQDEKGLDNKIVAVPLANVDPHFKDTKDIGDLDEHSRDVIKVFMEDYKKLEKEKYKFVKVKGWGSREKAMRLINKAVESYKV